MSDLRPDIIGSDKLTSLFGYWPTFHDAEVIDMTLRRGTDGNPPTLTATIHTFDMTNEVSSQGSYVCCYHCLVTMRFTGVEELKLDGFNHQNALAFLDIDNISETQPEHLRFKVSFDSAFGVETSFVCTSVEVLAVEPGMPEGSVYDEPTAPSGVPD